MIRERLVLSIENLAPTPIAWIAIVVGLFVHFAGFFLFKVEVPGVSELQTPEVYVSFVQLDETEAGRDLHDQAILSDSVPLFLPSQYDYGWEMLEPSYYLEEQNPEMLESFEFETTLTADRVLDLNAVLKPELKPADLLSSDLWMHFRTLGEADTHPKVLPERFGAFEFINEGTRERVALFPVNESPIDRDLSSIFWRPCEILVYVGVEGSIGNPLVVTSTEIPELDQYVVVEVRRIADQRLVNVGYYRVVFGP